MQPYATTAQALEDVLRLSRAMTYKIAAAGLPAGGAKSVILGDPARDKTPELLAAFAGAVNRLAGDYRCGADVGINAQDMDLIRQHTDFTPSGESGDLAIPTAQGVLHGLLGGVEFAFDRSSLEDVHIAVQGLGQVGARLCRLLADRGARLTVADIDRERCSAVADATGAAVVSPREILFTDADVLSPCALGGVLDRATVPRIKASVICGAANNQLASPEVSDQLAELGIHYVPDFVANAGGVVGGLQQDFGYTDDEKQERLAAIKGRTLAVLERARDQQISPHQAAELLAREFLAELSD
jgi:leucine dehydrogenase